MRSAFMWVAFMAGTCWWAALPAGAADWPRLNGPGGSGVSEETGLARAWPEGGPRVLWRIAVGEGFAGPAVFGGQVFLLDRNGDGEDVLRCLDLATGAERWTFAYAAAGKLSYPGSRNVPTVDEQHVFMVGPFGHMHCVDRRTGALIWRRHLVEDFKDPAIDREEAPRDREEKLARAQVPMWGMTQAPLLYGGTVIVAPQTQTTGLVALERATGRTRWCSGYIGRNWYSHVSPQLMILDGVEQVIMVAQPSDPEKAPSDAPPAIISSTDPATGRILWTTRTPRPHKIPMPQPLRVTDRQLFVTGGYGHGCLLLEVGRSSGEWDTRVQLQDRSVAGHIHSPILYQDRIHLISQREQGARHSGLVRLDREGRVLWQTGPQLQFDNGALLIADELAFVMRGRTGELHLFALSDSEPVLLAKAKVLAAEGGQAWAPMALAEGKLLVRDQHELKALEVRDEKSGARSNAEPRPLAAGDQAQP